jgi:DNA helicase-2/ATP-dependent DNA helicase PcrA
MVSKIEKEIEEQYLERVLMLVEGHLTRRREQSRDAKSALYGVPNQGFSTEVAGAWAVKNAEKATETLEKQREAPYFGRIDFLETGYNDNKEVYYVGKASVWDGNELIVIDWRAPVSSMYYSHGIGVAGYNAPGGYIHGEILLKRQYVFSGKSLNQIHETGGMNDSQEEAVDELLLSVLKRNATAQMRQIVQSIQKEQDQIIRSSGHIVVVQGPAGSGKTIIALHRAAYLLYQMREGRDRFAGQGNQISAQRMLVFSPNAIFSGYISSVLPDLQEDGIRQIILDSHINGELGRRLRGGKPFGIEQKEDHYEYMLLEANDPNYAHRAFSSSLKSSARMIECIRSYVSGLDETAEMCFQNVAIRNDEDDSDVVIHSRQELIDRYKLRRGQHGTSIISRLNDVVSYLADDQKRIENELKQSEREQRRQSLLNERQLVRQLPPLKSEIARLKKIVTDYQQIKLTDQYLAMLWKVNFQANNIPESDAVNAHRLTEEAFSRQRVLYEDALPLLLLDGFYRGFTPFGGLNHAIVDEAQDYSLLHFEYVKNCLPAPCSMTIVGDINQATNPQLNFQNYDSLEAVYSSGIKQMALTRSYRSSSEITSFASRILGDVHIDNVRRTGQKPVLVKLKEQSDMQSAVAFYVKRHTAAGAKTVAVLCKTRRDCDAIYPYLENQVGAKRLTSSSEDLSAAVVILPIYLAKGLEFDAVVIPNADANYYGKNTERRLLYTACTRALHEITLIYVDKPSSLMPIDRRDLYDATTWVPKHLQGASKIEINEPALSSKSVTAAYVAPQQQVKREYPYTFSREGLERELHSRREELNALIQRFEDQPKSQTIIQVEEHLIEAMLEQDKLEAMFYRKHTMSYMIDQLEACSERDKLYLPQLRKLLLE